jgi:hypothetical protein
MELELVALSLEPKIFRVKSFLSAFEVLCGVGSLMRTNHKQCEHIIKKTVETGALKRSTVTSRGEIAARCVDGVACGPACVNRDVQSDELDRVDEVRNRRGFLSCLQAGLSGDRGACVVEDHETFVTCSSWAFRSICTTIRRSPS